MARTPRTPRSRRALALVVALGACGSGGGDGGDEVADDTVVTTVAADPTPVSTVPPSVEPTTTEPTTTEPTTTEPTTTEPTTTARPTTTVVPGELVLDGTGVGVAEFGDPADAVIAAMSEVLGEPTDDTGWADPFSIGTCASNELRRVSWGSLGLTFGDNGTPGSRQFFTYSYGDVTDLAAEPVGLLTTTGIGIGASVADLRAAYPDVAINPGEEGLLESTWYVDDTLGGFLTGEADTDVVTVIHGGAFCG